jgi:hypothetical protein
VLTPTLQVALPTTGHTVNWGEKRAGFVVSWIFALAVPVVTQTKIAYRACVPGRTTLPLSDWTEMHNTPLGGGGGVVVVDGEGLGEFVGV